MTTRSHPEQSPQRAVADREDDHCPPSLSGDTIEDILISLGSQYHLIRPLPDRPNIFFYLALSRSQSNLATARLAVADAAKKLTI